MRNAIDFDLLLATAAEDGIMRITVGAYIIDDGGRLLLLRRSAGDTFENLFELPSGRVERNENLEDALIREIAEETHLVTSHVTGLVGYFDYSTRHGRTRQFNFSVMVEDTKQVALSEEHDSYVWADIARSDDTRFDSVLTSLIAEFNSWLSKQEPA